ncbi:hypothetical protein IC615_23690 [Serratia ureilytica]
MTQPLRPHLLTTGLSNHLVLLVDDINPLGICSLTLFRHPLKPSILARCNPARWLINECFSKIFIVCV